MVVFPLCDSTEASPGYQDQMSLDNISINLNGKQGESLKYWSSLILLPYCTTKVTECFTISFQLDTVLLTKYTIYLDTYYSTKFSKDPFTILSLIWIFKFQLGAMIKTNNSNNIKKKIYCSAFFLKPFQVWG